MGLLESAQGSETRTVMSQGRATGLSWAMLLVGAMFLALIGTWLVWFSAFAQRKFNEEDIREACHRTMPEAADRCYDTVIIQRGGVRR